MVFPQHYCAKCASEQIRRNGHRGGSARYRGKACGHQGSFQPAAGEKARQGAPVGQLLAGHNSLRSIARATGVARNAAANRVKKSVVPDSAAAPTAPEAGAAAAGGSAGTRRNGDVRGPRAAQSRVVAGRRTGQPTHLGPGAGLARHGHLAALVSRAAPSLPPHALVYRPVAGLCAGVASAHIVGKSGTRMVEAPNGKLRPRCGVLVRRSRSLSKGRVRHEWRVKIAINRHNSEIIPH